jgi:hypothetical protein
MARRNLRSLVMAAAILSLALGGEALGQAEWQTITAPNASFTVEMPGAPLYFPDINPPGEPPVRLHQYVLEQGETLYIAQCRRYPSGVDVSDPKAILTGGLQEGVKKPEWASIEWGTQQGAMTVEALGLEDNGDEKDNDAKRSFSAIKGADIYTLIYYGPRGTASSPDADRFIKSLKIAACVVAEQP